MRQGTQSTNIEEEVGIAANIAKLPGLVKRAQD